MREWREKMDEDLCQLCYAHGPDKRSVVMSCFYDLTEAVPEFKEVGGVYRLRVCKTCRSELLIRLQDWGQEAKKKRGFPKGSDGDLEFEVVPPERNIPIRRFGAVVMLNREEYDEWKKTDGLSGSSSST
jgi:hypothetical protein